MITKYYEERDSQIITYQISIVVKYTCLGNFQLYSITTDIVSPYGNKILHNIIKILIIVLCSNRKLVSKALSF